MKYRFRLLVKVASFWKPCVYATNVDANQRADILTGFGIVTSAVEGLPNAVPAYFRTALADMLIIEFQALKS